MAELRGGLQTLAEPERRTDAPGRPPGNVRLHPLEIALAGLLALAGIVILGRTALGAYLYAPVADMIDWAARVFQAERDGRWLAYLWDPHTAQRIPLARLVELADVEVMDGRAPSYLLATGLAWSCGLAALAVLLMRSRLGRAGQVWIAATAALIATNVGLAEDFAYPVFSVYLLVAGPALAAAALLQLAPREGWGGAPFFAALLFAALASGGNAAGLAVWPALLLVVFLQRRDGRQVVVLVVVAVLVGVSIEAGLGAPSTSLGRNADTLGAHVAKVATYFGIFGGLPWTRSAHPYALAALAGGAVWALAAYAFVRARVQREDEAAPLAACGAALIVFAALTALLASIGRVDELPAPVVPTRYTPFAVLLQLGTLLSLGRPLDAAFASPWRGRLVAAAVALLVLSHDLHGSRSLLKASAGIRAASDTFDRTGIQYKVIIYPIAARALEVRRELAARGLPH